MLSLFSVYFAVATALAGPDIYGLGNGQLGDVTLTVDTPLNAVRSGLGAAIAAGATSIALNDTSGFVVDGLVLVHHTQGPVGIAAPSASGATAAVGLGAAESLGQWELARVTSVSAGVLTLDLPMVAAFPVGGTQVVLVPEYASLTLSGNGVDYQVQPWDGSTGGVGALMVRGALVLETGTGIRAGGIGFRGGNVNPNDSSNGCNTFDSTISAGKGEGYFRGLYSRTGYGAFGNGAGGGNCHNAGGGGGGGGGNGGRGGNSNDGNRNVGGRGGGGLTFSDEVPRLLFGGGGGAGHQNNSNGTAGGVGSGAVLVRAASMSGPGVIGATGTGAANAGGVGNGDGIGGGGAGGTIVVQSPGAVACGTVNVGGGRGGNSINNHGAGGGGGGGHIWIESASTACSLLAAGGVRGVSTDSSDRNGVAGAAGVIVELGAFLPDYDGDGYASTVDDCDDLDPDINPDADEVIADGIDQDCDGLDLCYQDADLDGVGDDAELVAGPLGCVAPGFAPVGGDCDDADDTVGVGTQAWPDGDGDGFGAAGSTPQIVCVLTDSWATNDSDCDDTNPAINPTSVWYADVDLDGYGDPLTATVGCVGPTDYILEGGDCDDNDPDAFPGQVWFDDVDGDGFGDPASATVACLAPGSSWGLDDSDCDDTEAAINPNTVWYADVDNDGFGVSAHTFVGCVPPENFVLVDGDCNDLDPTVGVPFAHYPDNDGDGYGANGSTSTLQCPDTEGWAPIVGDCDDADASLNPATTWHRDVDGDGYGQAEVWLTQCSQPTGGIRDNTDCDDTRANVNPGQPEVCDGLDNDCNDLIDDEDPGVDTTNNAFDWYVDGDADGYGVGDIAGRRCTLGPNQALVGGDCDDNNALVFPGAVELCDNLDNNCNGDIDEGVVDQLWYPDADQDGFGAFVIGILDCAPIAGHVLQTGDCDDNNPNVNPSRNEICNGIDDNCDGNVDVNAVDAETWYEDADGDGYVWEPTAVRQCDAPGSNWLPRTMVLDFDCDDTDDEVYPLATEKCDGIDNNCTGLIDIDAVDAELLYVDADEDGFGAIGSPLDRVCPGPGWSAVDTDCDDTRPEAYPGAPELCNDLDDDCDGVVDNDLPLFTYYIDDDGDGWGNTEISVMACGVPDGYVAADGDCDDTDANINPGAEDIPGNGIDEDCDGQDAPRADRDVDIDGGLNGAAGGGCGCAVGATGLAGPAGPAGWAVLLLLVAARRRR